MNLIDTHCHIYSHDFDTDRNDVLSRAEYEGITKILMPAIDNTTHRQMFEVERDSGGLCKSMIGLHPCSVGENFRDELRIVEDWLAKRSFVAIGEAGLDFYWDVRFKNEQVEALQTQIGWALNFDIPIVLHSRNATDECIELIDKNQKGNLKGVFHCFSGTVEQAKKIIDLGCYLGIGGVITFKNSGLDKVLEHVSLENLVLETDAPYLAPVPFRGKRNECSYLKYVATKLADIKKSSLDEIAAITSANASKLFNLSLQH